MRVEVINTGTELLLGAVINTHLRAFAEALFPLGLRVERQITVPDGEAIRTALLESFPRAEVVLVTGGLGPTTDDITREITAELLGLELVHDPAIMEAIEQRFLRRGLTLGPRVARQAMRPQEALVLANGHGTAPGLYFPPQPYLGGAEGSLTPHVFLLPGPPRELVPMLHESVLPILRTLSPALPPQMQTWHVVGLGESHVEERAGEALLALGVELGYCARPGEVDVRVIGTAEQLAAADAILQQTVGAHIASRDGRALEEVVVQELTARQQTVAVAESCTGGFLAHTLTNVPGASAVFLAGYVTYANAAKTQALGVPAELIATHGAVSAPVAEAMAAGALAASGADYALATTGIAGPGGGSAEKPVGTVFIGLATKGEAPVAEHFRFPTDRATFKDLTVKTALERLRRKLVG